MAAIDLKEYEAQYFGFTAAEFLNFVFNSLVESWEVTVDEVLIPGFVKLADKELAPESLHALRTKLIARLFQHGRLGIIITKAQEYLSNQVFTIPINVTLPGDENKLVLKNDEHELMEQIYQLSKDITSLQLQLKEAEMRKQIGEVKAALEDCLAGPDFEELRQSLNNS